MTSKNDELLCVRPGPRFKTTSLNLFPEFHACFDNSGKGQRTIKKKVVKTQIRIDLNY